MATLVKVTWIETKLFLRDPATWLVSLFLPTILLVILGLIPDLRTGSEAFGGKRFIDLFIPSLIVITLATMGVNIMPIRLSTYREKGVLRRLSTTPLRPGTLLLAQLLLNLAVAVFSVLLLVVVGKLAFDVPVPQNLPGFILAFLVGMLSLFSLGLLVAAVAPTNRAGTAMAVPLFILVMFMGGVYLPRFLLPDLLNRLGEYTPPGVQTLLDTWTGTTPQLLPLLVMAGIALGAGILAVRLFRWE